MIVLNIKPLSLNNVYVSARNGRRFLSKEGKDYKKFIIHKLKDINFPFHENQYITLNIKFFLSDMMTKSGRIRKRRHDLDDFLKLFIDALCEGLGIPDDSFICNINCSKRPSTTDLIMFDIHAHDLDATFKQVK